MSASPLSVLGFTCRGRAELNFPPISEGDARVLERFIELYGKKGNVLDRLLSAARRKLEFSEESVRFWAPLLVDGRLGPIEALLQLDLEEIMVNGLEEPIFVYDRRKGMLRTNLSITSEGYFMELANRMLSSLGRRVNRTNPRESGVLDSGDRVSVVVPPYSRGHALSIRKYSSEPFTIVELAERGMLSYTEAAALWKLIEEGANVGIVGNTGSGKTTLLNALLRFVPRRERVVLVEEIPEIRPLQEQVLSLVSSSELGISMRDAIFDSLRLRPDRVVIGEVRTDGEVAALRESCLAGHALGTYFTYHAESAELARRRLTSQGFPEYDLRAITAIVVCRRTQRGGKLERRVVEVTARPSGVRERAGFLKKCRGLSDREFFEEIQGWYGV